MSVRSPPDFELFPVPTPNLADDVPIESENEGLTESLWGCLAVSHGFSSGGWGKVRDRGRVPASSFRPGWPEGLGFVPRIQIEMAEGARDFTKKLEVGRLGFLPARRIGALGIYT